VQANGSKQIAFSYDRFSKPEQEKGHSLARQKDAREAWLARHPEVRLDTSLRLVDRGVSGYRGDHRKKSRHALAGFFDLVQRGRIPAGSFLIVESLDRLTRENPVDAIPVVLDLVRAGIRIVQLDPFEMTYDSAMESYQLSAMLHELTRGNSESRRKSTLCGKAWRDKKDRARAEKKPHGAVCPSWIELADGRYRLRHDAVQTVHKIFSWCASGLGLTRILARLQAEKVPPIGKSGLWERSYVCKLLRNKAVIGVYQPGNGSGGRRPDGEPIAGYYPAAVDEALWYTAQKAIDSRRQRSGRPCESGASNPFAGLLYSALDGSKLHITTSVYKYLVNAAGIMQRGERRAFPFLPFKSSLLGKAGLRELGASELFEDPGAARLTELEGRLAEVDKRLEVALSCFEADPQSPTWSKKVSQYDREKRALVDEQTEARAVAQHPLSASWSEAVELMARDEPERLRAAVLATVQGIWCVFTGSPLRRRALVQVWFKGGASRSFLITHRSARGNPKAPADTQIISLAELAGAPVPDLRERALALQLEKLLASSSLH
jgi:DNA invertase Pin-like site-specific DNA recombinase